MLYCIIALEDKRALHKQDLISWPLMQGSIPKSPFYSKKPRTVVWSNQKPTVAHGLPDPAAYAALSAFLKYLTAAWSSAA